MKIIRILNNNSVVATDEKNREVVLFGAGLGYMKARGQPVEDEKIEKRFYMEEKKKLNRFAELINSIPMEYILFSQQIIDEAKIKYGKQLEDNIYISLPDHIANAVDGAKQGIHTKNPMLWDIKRFYKDEFEIGEYALTVIAEKTGIELEMDEAAYIALHFVNAEIGGSKDTALDITRMMQEISELVKQKFQIDFDEESLAYYRYITHLKFFAQRVLNQSYYTDEDEDLFRMVIRKYPEEYGCVKQICEFLEKDFSYRVGIDEKTYLTVHIARVVKR
ncbi:BglG family transcription antiterminator LicT [Kineothrix sp. MB12-C1]|uniref:BglG family transcription antiterminator LicT n=1 Tax=Kineothrix sp. MB12-C1 TaxID=3070215 RepID=UPI0027D304AE|nr:PRD domain-containing protein [Kineothrix sp. MB12-C1]WMC91881.1 PRD domain-containing protein [Kineothrix sp. MB12-C1]